MLSLLDLSTKWTAVPKSSHQRMDPPMSQIGVNYGKTSLSSAGSSQIQLCSSVGI